MMQADETAPPRKRARTSSRSDIDDPQPLKQDEEFWYDDGTIVLIAANIEFRVYRGPLAKHSPVFRDMLALPQPLISQSTSQSTSSASEGPNMSPACPTVHVTDSPADLRHFLRAFVPGGILEPIEAPSFYTVSAWIRLGHKYEVDKLVENGLQYLRRFYPNTLCSASHSCPGPIKRDRPEDVQRQAAIAIVNLARLTGSDDLLPLALLECCKLNAEIVNGYTREDGTVEYLQPDDMGRCFAAKDVLALQTVASCLHVFEYARVDAGCRDAKTCQDVLHDSALDFRTMNVDFLAVDELLKLQQTELFTVDTGALCSRCRPKVRKAIEERRREFWNALPERLDVAVGEQWAGGATELD